MERLYRVLAWLAGIALVVGLVKAALFWTLAINALGQSSGLMSSSDGLLSVFLTMLAVNRGQVFISAANLLVGGVTVTALFIAWADHRRGWLIALIVLTLLSLLWPLGVQTWDVNALPTAPPYSPSLLAQIVNDSLYAIPLIPLALALIFALTKRDGAARRAQGIAIQPM